MKPNKKKSPQQSEPETLDQAQETQTPQADGSEPVATEEAWRSALETAVKQRDEYLLMAQRTQADFQNFKRRNAQTRSDALEDGTRETLAALLPILDSFDRALASIDENDTSPVAEGIRMVHRQLMDTITRLGLTEIPALGEKFDPELHNAVMRSEEGEPGTVLEVFEKGYRVKDKIIRYSMVKVAVE